MPPVKPTSVVTGTEFNLTGILNAKVYLLGNSIAIDINGVPWLRVGASGMEGVSIGKDAHVGVGAYDSFVLGRGKIADGVGGAVCLCTDSDVRANYALAAGDGHLICAGAVGAVALGFGQVLGDPAAPAAGAGSNSIGVGSSNTVRGRNAGAIGAGCQNDTDCSLVVGEGSNIAGKLKGPTEKGVVCGGANGKTWQVGPSGLILTSPSGKRWLISVSDDGQTHSVAV